MTLTLRIGLAAALVALAPPAAASTAPLPGPAEVFHFLGTEPFWGGEVRGGRMKLDWPDNEHGVWISVRRRVASGRLVFTGRLTRYPHFLAAGPYTMTVVRRDCSDGMSERTYPYDVTIVAGRHRATGCGYTARRPFREDPGG